MKVEIEVKEYDYWNFYRHTVNTFSSRSESKRAIGILGAIVLVGVFTVGYIFAVETLGFEFVPNAPLIILLGFISLISIGLYMENFKRLSTPLRDGVMLGKQTIEVTEDGLYVTSENHNTSTSWDAVVELAETKLSYLIYVDVAAACIIPKRYFASSKEQQEFYNYVENQITH